MSEARRRDRVLRPLLRRVWQDSLPEEHYSETMWRNGFWSAERFFDRLPAPVPLEGADLLDVGCGTGNLCVLAVRRGARSATGVDYNPLEIDLGRRMIASETPDAAERVELIVGADLSPLGDRDFDVIVSKDSFEHYQQPEEMFAAMESRLRPGGHLAIGFGPLWNAPYGPHLDTRLPWVHHLFPERLLLEEWNALRPGKHATRLEDTGVNRMTLARFERMVEATRLTRVGYARNVSDHPAVRAMDALSRVRPLRELMVTNVYGVWRRDR